MVQDIQIPLMKRFESDEQDHPVLIHRDVAGNIENILRSVQLGDAEYPPDSLRQYSLVRKSVVNFGVPDYVGALRNGVSSERFCKAVKEALTVHEPRLNASSIVVSVDGREPSNTELLSGEFSFNITAKVEGLSEHLSMLTVTTVMHPFRLPEVTIGRRR